MADGSMSLQLACFLAGMGCTHGAEWYFRPARTAPSLPTNIHEREFSRTTGELHHVKSRASGTAAPGATYDTAWTTTAAIQWDKIAAGDTLYVCGLHDTGRVDGALNITWKQGSGHPDAPVILDGGCQTPGGVPDPGVLMSGTPVPSTRFTPPDSHGIRAYTYPTALRSATDVEARRVGFGRRALGNMANRPDVLERPAADAGGVQMQRLAHGNCSDSGPVDPAEWAPGTACYAGVWTNSTTVYYKPTASSDPVGTVVYIWSYALPSAPNGWPPLAFHNASHVVAQNLTLQGPSWELVSMVGGHHVTLRTSTLRWAQFAGVTLGDVPNLRNTDTGWYLAPGIQHAQIVGNYITQTACGVYTIAMSTWQNSNDLYVGYNRFVDIDTENHYGNGDTHAIGIQGGSRNLFEHNVIDGAGGSGITFYQGPDNPDGLPPQEMHDNIVRYNVVANISGVAPKNQHGIEVGGSRYVWGNLSYNNSVDYNLLINVRHIALRSKTLTPPPGHGVYQWRWRNNVVVDAGVGFSSAYECLDKDPVTPCYKPELVANNAFVNSRFAHHDGWGTPKTAAYRDNDWRNNLYYPDGPTLFCYGLCAWPGQLPCTNCTSFATFEQGQPTPTHSLLAPPGFVDISTPPLGFRPAEHSPLLHRGLPVGLSRDFLGVTVSTTQPSIGAFERAADRGGPATAPLVTVGASPDSESSRAKASTVFYFRGSPVAVSAPGRLGAALSAVDGDGRTYASAWRTAAAINWTMLNPGDTLYLCGRMSQGLNVPPYLSGSSGNPVTIDGGCPLNDGSGRTDPVLWVGGNPLLFPQGWEGPDVNGLYTLPYGGTSKYAVWSPDPNSTDVSTLTRAHTANCTANGPVDPESWRPGTYCQAQPALPNTLPLTPQLAELGRGEQRGPRTLLYYKPPLDTFGSGPPTGVLYLGWPSPLRLDNTSYVTVQGVTLAGVANELVVVNGGVGVAMRNNTLQWAENMAVMVTRTQALLVEDNTVWECACGVYIVAMSTGDNSNHVIVRRNRFLDIDTQNVYGNGDTHAIGIQGGSFNLFEENYIDGAGGSGITFYQGPDDPAAPPQAMHDNTVRYNIVLNVKDGSGRKNQHGIEVGGSGYADPTLVWNNSVYYNVLSNITHIGFRSKAMAPPPGHGRFSWRWLNNVLHECGVGFSTVFQTDHLTNVTNKAEQIANNIFSAPQLAHRDGWAVNRVPGSGDVWENNLYWPNGQFCFGLCAWPGEAPCSNCTDYAGFAKAGAVGNGSMLKDPLFANGSRAPWGLQPEGGSPARRAGVTVAVGLPPRDIAGRWLAQGLPPDIGAFLIS